MFAATLTWQAKAVCKLLPCIVGSMVQLARILISEGMDLIRPVLVRSWGICSLLLTMIAIGCGWAYSSGSIKVDGPVNYM
jgi:hypothetical protein